MNINAGNANDASRRINADTEIGRSINMIYIAGKVHRGARERNINNDNVNTASRRINDKETDRSSNIKTTEVQHESNKKTGADSINKIRRTSTDEADQFAADNNVTVEPHQYGTYNELYAEKVKPSRRTDASDGDKAHTKVIQVGKRTS